MLRSVIASAIVVAAAIAGSFASARALWDSPLGRALRNSEVPTVIELDEEYTDGSDESQTTVLEASDFERMTARAESAGVLSSFDAWFLRQLSHGETIEDLANAPETRRALEKPSVTKKMIETYANGLRDRIATFVRSLT